MGLCKIYQEYGPEHMGNTCKLFPRACLNIEGKTTFSMLNHSCEEVLKRIFEHAKVMEKHVYPAIEEAIHPDVLTYALAFMVLF